MLPDEPGIFFVPVHNVFMLMLVELGFLGAVAWAAIFLSPLVWYLIGRRGFIDADSLMWLGGLIVILVVSLVEFSPWATQDARLLMFAVLGLWVGSLYPTPSDFVVAEEKSETGKSGQSA